VRAVLLIVVIAAGLTSTEGSLALLAVSASTIGYVEGKHDTVAFLEQSYS
jgi:hypothetical protein